MEKIIIQISLNNKPMRTIVAEEEELGEAYVAATCMFNDAMEDDIMRVTMDKVLKRAKESQNYDLGCIIEELRKEQK